MRNTLSSDDNALLPRTELTATTTLGGTKPDDEVKGQTLAVMVAEAVLTQRPGEERLLVVGFGAGLFDRVGQGWDALMGLCLEVL